MKGLYEKVAFAPLAPLAAMGARAAIGAGARALGTGALHAGRAFIGQGAAGTLTGAAKIGRGVGNTLNGANQAAGLYQTAQSLMPPPPAPSSNSANVQASSLSPSMKTSALETRLAKLAFGASNAANIGGYLSLIGAEAVPHDNPWHVRLEALGLGTLAASTAGSMIANPEERDPGQKDLAGLALFASALRDRMGRKHAEEKQAFGLAADFALAGMPSAAGYMVGRYSNKNLTKEQAEAVLGRRLSGPELLMIPGYLGHFYGERDAARLAAGSPASST